MTSAGDTSVERTRPAPAGRLAALCRRAAGTTAGKGAVTLLDQAVVSGMSFATAIAVGRFAGEAELGLYSLGVAVAVFFLLLQESLICTPYLVFVHRLAPGERPAYGGRVLAYHRALAAACAAALLLAGAAAWLAGSRFGPLLAALGCALPFLLLRDLARRYAFAHLRPRAALAVDGSVAVLQLAALGVLLYAGWLGAVAAHLAAGLACLAAGALWLAASRGEFAPAGPPPGVGWGRHWAFGRWIFASQEADVAHSYSMHWLLVATLGLDATGRFAACMTLIALTGPLFQAVTNIAAPKAAAAHAREGVAGVRRVTLKAAAVLAGLMAGFSLFLLCCGEAALALVFGRDFGGYGPTLTLLAVYPLVNVTHAADPGLWVLERPAAVFWANALCLAVTLGAAAWAVPAYGLFGAAASLLAGAAAGSALRTGAFLVYTSGPRTGGTHGR